MHSQDLVRLRTSWGKVDQPSPRDANGHAGHLTQLTREDFSIETPGYCAPANRMISSKDV